MDEQGYHIETDPAPGRLRITFHGFWHEAMAAAFAIDLGVALDVMAAGGIAPGRYLAILDLRDHAILSQEMVARFCGFAEGPGQVARRVAVLVEGTLQTMQLRRVAAPLRDHRFFLLESEAEAWIEEAADELA